MQSGEFNFTFNMGIYIDNLSALMLIVVAFISTLGDLLARLHA